MEEARHPDSPALAYIGKEGDRQAIGWTTACDAREPGDTGGSVVIYDSESTSEGWNFYSECRPADAKHSVRSLVHYVGFRWADTEEADRWCALAGLHHLLTIDDVRGEALVVTVDPDGAWGPDNPNGWTERSVCEPGFVILSEHATRQEADKAHTVYIGGWRKAG